MINENRDILEISSEDIAIISKRFFNKDITREESVKIFDHIDIDLVLDIASQELDHHRKIKVAYSEIEKQIKEQNLI